MISVADLCALLSLAHGPGVDRSDAEPLDLPLLTAAGDHPPHQRLVRLLRDYAPFDLFARRGDSVRLVHRLGIVRNPVDESWSLHLGEPGTVNLLKTGLTLAVGLDPGPMGLGCAWRRSSEGWILSAASGEPASTGAWVDHFFTNFEQHMFRNWTYAPEVYAELDNGKALMLACQHTISEKR